MICWGNNDFGQLGLAGGATCEGADTESTCALAPGAPASVADATAVFAGGDSTCAKTAGGTVYCWGNVVKSNGNLPPTPVAL